MRYVVLTLALMLAACGNEGSVTVTTRAAEITVARPADPLPLQMLPVNFVVVNKINQTEQIKMLMTENESFVGMAVRDYENLRVNLSDVLRYIQQQQAVIKYYETMTKGPQAKDE